MRLLKIVFLLLLNTITAQSISNDWIPITSDEESTIYLNPSKIIGYGNEISVWAFEKLEKPTLNDKNENISRIKTHYLFNKMKKRYSEIGVIYYNERGQIANRSSKSNFQGTLDAFMTPIKSNPNVEIIYKEVISFLITGNFSSIDVEPIDTSTTKVDDSIDMEIPTIHRQLAEKQINNVPRESTNESDSLEIALLKAESNSTPNIGISTVKTPKENDDTIDLTKESWTNIPTIDKRLEVIEKPTITLDESSKYSIKKKADESINIQVPSKTEYNSNNEKALKNAIFTDGNLYCFQVSSWKTKAYADRELNKLVSEGYNAFLVSVKPKNKRSIWHRVRVGYFNTLEEAKRVQRLVGKR